MTFQTQDQVLLGLGSNVGDRRAHLRAAVQALEALPGVEILSVSRLYETEAWGGPADQGPFLNAALTMTCRLLSMPMLLEEIMTIESEQGRLRTVANGPRTLDIDILLCGGRLFETQALSIPHVAMHERSFVLRPAAEVAGNMRHPRLQKTIQELSQEIGVEGLIRVHSEKGWYHALGHPTCQ